MNISKEDTNTVREDRQMTSFDFSALSATDATVPTSTRAAKRDNPFGAWLKESYDKGTGKAVTVPAANVAETVYLIRQAANELNIGSRVVLQDSKGNVLTTDRVGMDKDGKGGKIVVVKEDGTEFRSNVKVLFAGKNRKQRRTTEQAAPVSA